VVAGHSIGELAAAFVAGCGRSRMRVRWWRPRPVDAALPSGGAMVATEADEERVAEAMAGCDRVGIAAVNGPARR